MDIFSGYLKQKNKSRTAIKKDNEKQEMIKNVSSCIIEKFRGFDIVSIEYGREQQTKFSSIDILHKPVKNGMILLSAIRAEFYAGKKRHTSTFQCYYCSSYYVQKGRYQKHIEKCSGILGIVYNFTNQNVASFAETIGNKGDLPLVVYMDFETTAQRISSIQNRILCSSFHIL